MAAAIPLPEVNPDDPKWRATAIGIAQLLQSFNDRQDREAVETATGTTDPSP